MGRRPYVPEAQVRALIRAALDGGLTPNTGWAQAQVRGWRIGRGRWYRLWREERNRDRAA